MSIAKKPHASPGFFALSRLIIPGQKEESGLQVIPAIDASENNAAEAQFLGWLVFVSWLLAIDSAISMVPWFVRLPLAALIAFILIQVFTVGVAFVLERTFVARGRRSATTVRAWHTSGHAALLVVLSVCLITAGLGSQALKFVAWIWLSLAIANTIAAIVEHRP